MHNYNHQQFNCLIKASSICSRAPLARDARSFERDIYRQSLPCKIGEASLIGAFVLYRWFRVRIETL